jgi:hypothetical protein
MTLPHFRPVFLNWSDTILQRGHDIQILFKIQNMVTAPRVKQLIKLVTMRGVLYSGYGFVISEQQCLEKGRNAGHDIWQ